MFVYSVCQYFRFRLIPHVLCQYVSVSNMCAFACIFSESTTVHICFLWCIAAWKLHCLTIKLSRMGWLAFSVAASSV